MKTLKLKCFSVALCALFLQLCKEFYPLATFSVFHFFYFLVFIKNVRASLLLCEKKNHFLWATKLIPIKRSTAWHVCTYIYICKIKSKKNSKWKCFQDMSRGLAPIA